MNISLILVPTDFTQCALNSLNYAYELAELYNAELILMHVVDTREAQHFSKFAKEFLDAVLERLTNQATQSFRKFLKDWKGNKRVKDTIVSAGAPFQEIALKARDFQVDLLVMGGYGSRGKGGQIEEIFFGSTVEKVVRLLPCPVLCVPIGWMDEQLS